MATDQLKQTLLALHATLASGAPLDSELQALLRLLDADIHTRLTQDALAPQVQAEPLATPPGPAPAPGETATQSVVDAPAPSGLGSRAQEISARFAAGHPHLEPVLRELTDTLQRIGI